MTHMPTEFTHEVLPATLKLITVPAEPPASGGLEIRVGRNVKGIAPYYDIVLDAETVMALYGFLKRAIYEGEFL